MTFIRPAYPIDISGLPSIPSRPRPVGQLYLDPSDVGDVVKEYPEIIHSGVGFLVTALAPPPARLAAKAAFEVVHYGGHVLWDRAAYWFPSEWSSESSSQSGPNVRGDQNGGSGGTLVFSSYGSLPPGTAVHKAGWNPDTSDFFKKKGKHHCKKGYTLAKIGGAMMCIKLPRKK